MSTAGRRDLQASPQPAAPVAAERAPERLGPYRELSRLAGNDAVGELLGGLITVPDPGAVLAPALRGTLEAAFGRDLGHVRVHEGPEARATAALLGARAFAAGRDIWLGRDAPGDTALLGHEVAHVIQQGGAPPAPRIAPDAGAAEHAAAQAGEAVAAGRPGGPVGTAPAGVQLAADSRKRRPEELATDTEVADRVEQVGGATTDPGLSSAARAQAKTAIDSVRFWQSLRRLPISPETWAGTVDGREVRISGPQLAQSSAAVQGAFGVSLSEVRRRADDARRRFRGQVEADREQPLASAFAYGLAEIRSGGTLHTVATDFPGRYHETLEQIAETEVALARGQFVEAMEAHVRAETAAETCAELVQAYTQQIIGATEGTITALQWTRTLSFVTLGVLATIVSGGAAAGAIGATTTVAGVSVGTTAAATAISVGAPIAAALAESGMRAELGMRIDWVKVTVDTIFEVAMSRIPGGKLGGALAKQLYRPLLAVAPVAGRTALARIGVTGLARAIESVLLGQGQGSVKAAVDEVYVKLRGGAEVTWGTVLERVWLRILEQLRDPTGYLMAVLMATISTSVDVRYGGHGLVPPAGPKGAGKAPAAATMEEPAGKPKTEYEDWKAFEGMAEKIPAPAVEGPMVGKRVGVLDPAKSVAPAQPRKPPTLAERKLVRDKVVERDAAAMDDLGDPTRGGDPRLRAAVETSETPLADGRRVMAHAVESAQPFKRLWRDYVAGRPANEISADGFAEYIKSVGYSERGRYGEVHSAFVRGPDEIVVQAPGGVSEKGIDMVTHKPGGRTNLLDNKAIKSGKRQGEVSALEENLPKNLAETIGIVKKYAGQEGVHPSIAGEALPRLEKAKLEIDAWVKKYPKVELESDEAQKAFAAILDDNKIDRIVTLAGAGTKTGITKPLGERGFTSAPH